MGGFAARRSVARGVGGGTGFFHQEPATRAMVHVGFELILFVVGDRSGEVVRNVLAEFAAGDVREALRIRVKHSRPPDNCQDETARRDESRSNPQKLPSPSRVAGPSSETDEIAWRAHLPLIQRFLLFAHVTFPGSIPQVAMQYRHFRERDL